jgi:hypothetical protein
VIENFLVIRTRITTTASRLSLVIPAAGKDRADSARRLDHYSSIIAEF